MADIVPPYDTFVEVAVHCLASHRGYGAIELVVVYVYLAYKVLLAVGMVEFRDHCLGLV